MSVKASVVDETTPDEERPAVRRDTPRALIVEDERSSRDALAELVEQEGFETWTATTLARARDLILAKQPDVILCDLKLPDGEGTELLSELAEDPSVEVILVTGQPSIDTAIEALRLEAYDYLTKPVDMPRLKTLLAGFHRTRELKEEVSSLREQLRELGRFGPLVGTSEAMQKVYDLIDRVAPTNATALLVGESGTGKELAARTLHRLSRRRREPFLPVNCGAVAPNLIESELFGHEKGAFTGADRQHQGVFERADGGTLFLDEITEMPLELQVKLLRVLETGSFRRVGGRESVEADVRLIASTNRVPEEAVRAGEFREDLYYRLNVFPIRLPPLRNRRGDIRLLTRHFLDGLNRSEGTEKHIRKESLEVLESHTWPGNVRELENVVRRAYILADDVIEPDNLPTYLTDKTAAPLPETGPRLQVPLGSSIEEAEKRLIQATLAELEDDKKKAAEILGISLKTLYNRLKQYREDEAEE